MKNILFPKAFRIIGWLIFILGLAASVLDYFEVINTAMGRISETIYNDAIIIGIMLGPIFIACSKEPHEDEMTRAIRLASLLNALYAYLIVFIAGVIFINGVEFLEFILISVFLLPILFAFIFRAEMHRYYKENADEE